MEQTKGSDTGVQTVEEGAEIIVLFQVADAVGDPVDVLLDGRLIPPRWLDPTQAAPLTTRARISRSPSGASTRLDPPYRPGQAPQRQEQEDICARGGKRHHSADLHSDQQQQHDNSYDDDQRPPSGAQTGSSYGVVGL
jgi:hypothetical protein